MADRFTYDVFLSHNSRDKPRVRRIAERLKKAGLRVWFDEWVIKAGDDIYLAIERGLEAARVQVLCLSPEALGSDWVTLERNTVLFRDPTNSGRRFVPLLISDCALPNTLRRYKYVDFREETQTAFEELHNACLGEVDALSSTKEADPNKEPAEPKSRVAKRTEQSKLLAVFQRKLTAHKEWTNSLAVSSDGTWVASGSKDEPIKIWDLETGECRTTLGKHKRQEHFTVLATVPHSERVVSSALDFTIRVWNVTTCSEVAVLKGHSNRVRSVVPLSDGVRVLSGGWDGTLKLWDLGTGNCLNTITCGVGDGSQVFCCAVDQLGKLAVSGHRNGRVLQWDLESGECLATLEGHSDLVSTIQITPDGRFAVSGSDDQTLKLWDLEASICVGTLEGTGDHVDGVAISHDGTLIASTGFNQRSVRLWDWKTGVCLQILKLEGVNPATVSVAFDTRGTRLLVGTCGGEIHIFSVSRKRPTSLIESTRRYVNAKVVLLGEGTVGKTTLAHRLIEDNYVIRDRTHGMNVWPLELPPPPDDNLERDALLWDLAGQEDYRLIHRLFLDETALALLLINPQKDDPFSEAGDWLQTLDTVGGVQRSKRIANRLLVFSQIDVGGMKIGDAKIERFAKDNGFDAWLATSAKTGENCSDQANGGLPSTLKQLIAKCIPWDKLPWTATPRLLAELKDALMKMRDTSDIRLLRFVELVQRLDQALPGGRFDEAEVRTAVTLLANHGLVLQLKFGDLVLLQPELLNGYAGAVIRTARTHKDEIGCLQEADIYRPDFDFTGVDRLSRADEELLLRALVQTFLDHSLCIAEETSQGRQLVFPSQYRREKDIPWEPDVFVSYTFRGEWQTIWTTLLVRLWYSQEFEQKELWRNAAQFASSREHLLGLKIDNRQGEGEATISLFFDFEAPDELKVIFIEYVHRHLANYCHDVIRDRRYVCAGCNTPITNLFAVRKRLEAGKDFITCQICDDRVPLIDFIEQRLKSDPVARQILAMEETSTQGLDTQALEQILIGHMMATCGEANQLFRPVNLFDHGIDGEVEFRDNDGRPSGKKIYVQLKSDNAYLHRLETDQREVYDVKNGRQLEYWASQPVDVYLVVRQPGSRAGGETISWMNVTRYLRSRKNKSSRQIVFDGEPLTMEAIWRLRDSFFPRHVDATKE